MALNNHTKNQLLGALGDPEAVLDLIDNIDSQGAGDIKRDGTVPFIADQSMGGNKLTNVEDPTADQDAATKKYVDDNSSSGTVTSVTASAPLASSGGVTPNISLTGTVAVANGGTGQTSASNAINALLPSQATHSGEFLTTNGTVSSWVANAVPNILVFTSSATVGGAAAEALTVTGLLATDTILSVTQKTQGSGNLPLLAWSAQANDSITGHWVGDPVVGAVLLVAVKR